MKQVVCTKNIRKRYVILVLIGCSLLTWLTKDVFKGVFQTGTLNSYVSPTVVITAMCYVYLFANIQIGEKVAKWISFFAPASFGVYLIHDNNYIRELFVAEYIPKLLDFQVEYLIPLVFACAIGIFILCLFIEKARQKLFDILHITHLLKFIGSKMDLFLHKIEEKF